MRLLTYIVKKIRDKNTLENKEDVLEKDKVKQENYSKILGKFLSNDSEKRYITVEKEEAILKQIAVFEQEKSFLDKDMSLSVLAGRFGVNHRYLSYVVNKHKDRNFSTYVNELRIIHIVNCLKKDPEYLKYKISYLAEQSGFASHSRFTVTFKKVTRYSPSVFIDKLIHEQTKKNK